VWVVLCGSVHTMHIICLFWQFFRCLKFFFTCCVSSFVVTLHIFCLRLLYVFHTSHNKHEFYLRSLRFFLEYSISNLAESKLFLPPKLSNVPPKFLLFLPFVSRYVHQHYCICYLYHERYPHNITVSTTNITRSTQVIILFLYQY